MRKIYLLFIILLLCTSIYFGFMWYKSNQQIDLLTEEVLSLEEDIDNLEYEINSKEEEIVKLNEELSKVEYFDKSVYDPINSYGKAYIGSAIETNINGTFEGWTGDTVFKMLNGTVWQQAEYSYLYHYSYMPSVWIYSKNGMTYMSVEGVEDEILVRRLR